MPAGNKTDNVGLKPERPFQILGITTEVTLGDLLANVVFLSTLAHQFDYARLHIKYRDVRPYSRDVMSLSPLIDLAEPLPGEWPKIVRRFKPDIEPRRYPDVGRLNGGRATYYDMVVTNQMARSMTIHTFPDPVPLALPDDQSPRLKEQLVTLGLRPDQWHATIHHRESSYKFRPHSGERDNTPEAFDELVDFIISLGGQVVRVGHTGMAPFKKREGFIDLARRPDSFMLQAAAVSLARFAILGPSGPVSLSMGFGTPATIVDSLDRGGVWGTVTDLLTQELTTSDGRILRNQSLVDAGLMDSFLLRDLMKRDSRYKIRKTSAAELKEVAFRLFERTKDCPAWRPALPLPVGPKPNSITWPPRPTYPMRWVGL